MTVDVVDVTVLVDNFVDVNLSSTEVAHQPPRHYDWAERSQLRAEHGYALLVTVRQVGEASRCSTTPGTRHRAAQHRRAGGPAG